MGTVSEGTTPQIPVVEKLLEELKHDHKIQTYQTIQAAKILLINAIRLLESTPIVFDEEIATIEKVVESISDVADEVIRLG